MQHVQAAGIDTDVFKYIVSDHACIFADLAIPIKIERLDDRPQTTVKFRKITKIKVKEVNDTDADADDQINTQEGKENPAEKLDSTQFPTATKFVFDQSQFKTPATLQDEEVFNSLQEKAAKAVHSQQLDNIDERLDALQEQLVEQVLNNPYNRQRGELPPPKPGQLHLT